MTQTVFADLGRGGQHSHLAKLRQRPLRIEPGVVHLKFCLESLSDGLAVPPPLGSRAGSSRVPAGLTEGRVPMSSAVKQR